MIVVAAIVAKPRFDEWRKQSAQAPDFAPVEGTIIFDTPLPKISSAAPKETAGSAETAAGHAPSTAESASAPARPRLAKNLLIARATMVDVPQGVIGLRPGVAAQLVEDRGDEVVIRVGSANVVVARDVVDGSVAAEPEPAVERPSVVGRIVEAVRYAPPTTFGIDAHEIGTGRGIDRKWETDWGSYSRDFYSTKGLEVNIRNVSRRDSGDCEIWAYWMAKRLGSDQPIVHHAEKVPFDVEAMSSKTVRFWCPLSAANKTNYELAGVQYTSGTKITGWIVVVARNNHTLVARTSAPMFENLVKSPDQFQSLVASYRPSGRSATESMPHWRSDPVRAEWQTQKYRDVTSTSK